MASLSTVYCIDTNQYSHLRLNQVCFFPMVDTFNLENHLCVVMIVNYFACVNFTGHLPQSLVQTTCDSQCAKKKNIICQQPSASILGIAHRSIEVTDFLTQTSQSHCPQVSISSTRISSFTSAVPRRERWLQRD